MKAVVRFNSIA